MEATVSARSLSSRPHSSRARPLVAALLLVAWAAPAVAERNGPFLRTEDSRLAAALIRGRDESPTFRAIVDRLDASNLIVYVSRGALRGETSASTQLLTSTGGYRYVRVTLELDPDTDVGVAMLGHELRHALELADAPWAVDDGTVMSLYKKIGYASCMRATPCYDTQEAVDAGRQVLAELRHVSRGLYPLGLPVALRKEPRAHDRQREERNAYRNERAGGAETGFAGQEPRERNLP
jgi:hypothetical protein